MSAQICFDNQSTCIVLITGRKLHAPDGKKIENTVKEVISKDPYTNSYFHGNSCGKYDHIMEFKNPTAKVARYLMNSIRRSMVEKLPKSRRLATSVVLGTEVGPSGCKFSFGEDFERSIRLYTFLRAQGNQLPFFVKTITDLNAYANIHFGSGNRVRLIWTDSVFAVMTISTDILRNALLLSKRFLEKAKNVDSSTIASLRYGQDDATKNLNLSDLYGLVFVKLKNISRLRIKKRTDFLPFAADLGLQPFSLGDYDKCLLTKKQTLADIMEVTRQLKIDNRRKLLHTATILLSGRE